MLSADAPIRVQMEDISKSFGAIKSLDRVNLVLRAGEVLGLVGDNGAGKVDAEQDPVGRRHSRFGPHSARRPGSPVRFARRRATPAGRDGVSRPVALRHGRRRRQPPAWPRAAQARCLACRSWTSAKMHADAARMLDHLGIRMPSTRLKVENLSGGQRQSIAIGRAVSFDPLVLIMDEPTAALAVAEVDAVLELIRTVSAEGRQRHSHHPPAAGSVCRLRPDHGAVRGPQRRRAAHRRDEYRGDRQPHRGEKIPVDLGRGDGWDGERQT